MQNTLHNYIYWRWEYCFIMDSRTEAGKEMCWHQWHLGIYYYVETRSYGMFRPQAPTFPVLGCRSAGKLAPRPPSTTPMAPPQRPQDCGTTATIHAGVGVRKSNFPWRWHFQIFASYFPKTNWTMADDIPSGLKRTWGGGAQPSLNCGFGTESRGPMNQSLINTSCYCKLLSIIIIYYNIHYHDLFIIAVCLFIDSC